MLEVSQPYLRTVRTVQRHVLVWGYQFYILKGVSIAGDREKNEGHHHPLQETEASGTHTEASCPDISSWVMEKCLAWHQSRTSEPLALAPGFGFLKGPRGKHFRSVMTQISSGTKKIHGKRHISRTTYSTPTQRKNFTEAGFQWPLEEGELNCRVPVSAILNS